MKKLSLVLAFLGASIGTAMADVPAEVTQQLDSVKADIGTVGGALIVLACVAMGFRWLKAQFF